MEEPNIVLSEDILAAQREADTLIDELYTTDNAPTAVTSDDAQGMMTRSSSAAELEELPSVPKLLG